MDNTADANKTDWQQAQTEYVSSHFNLAKCNAEKAVIKLQLKPDNEPYGHEDYAHILETGQPNERLQTLMANVMGYLFQHGVYLQPCFMFEPDDLKLEFQSRDSFIAAQKALGNICEPAKPRVYNAPCLHWIHVP